MLTNLPVKFDAIKLAHGVYETDLNFHFTLEFNQDIVNAGIRTLPDYKPIVETHDRYVSCYGVCDNHEQILTHIPEVKESEQKFIISLTLIRKADQDENGGWRWHKWGEYIGTQNPQCEYIYDEPTIEQVYVYHIYRIEVAGR
jgi:hypothetical protein